MHGWYPEAWPLEQADHLFYVTLAGLQNTRLWVTTKRQETFLRGRGYTEARAIGLPIAYVKDPRVTREAGSLLVMPAHSLPGNDRAAATREYVDSIKALRPHFARICVCINGHDWDRGNWIGEFSEQGFEVMRGAGDKSTFQRNVALFSRFEAVTTNGFGSLIAYASACGAKASFYGRFSEVGPDTLRNLPFFIDNPGLIEAEAQYTTEHFCRETLPQFFCHPAEAEEHVDWGRAEIGRPDRVSPEEMREFFGWSPASRARSAARSAVTRLASSAASSARAAVRRRRERGDQLQTERRRLEALRGDSPGAAPLFGGSFAFRSPRELLAAYDDCFIRESYRFRATSEEPRVIDGSAGTGMAVLYCKSLYPRARVLAFEQSREAFAALEANCETFGLEDVQLRLESSWGVGARRALRDWLTDGDRIDLVKMDLAPANAASLPELSELFASAESVVIDYTARGDESQNLAPVFRQLQDAGLRAAIQTGDLARRRPLVTLPSIGDRVTRLRILGFRL
jgi:hypothetical protein